MSSSSGTALVDGGEELLVLHSPMPASDLGDHGPVRTVERGEQAGHPRYSGSHECAARAKLCDPSQEATSGSLLEETPKMGPMARR
jgi:hypothetical protein